MLYSTTSIHGLNMFSKCENIKQSKKAYEEKEKNLQEMDWRPSKYFSDMRFGNVAE